MSPLRYLLDENVDPVLNPVMSVGDTLDDLWLIASAADETEYRDRIVYLPV